MNAWLRRNRWGLLALPVATVVAIGANAQRLEDFWWNQELRHAAATGDRDQWVSWTDGFADAAGPGTRTIRVKVTAAEPADVDLPSDLVGWRMTLDVEAAPNQVLSGCLLALADSDGNRYVYRPQIATLSQDLWPCVPEDSPGPAPSIAAGQARTVAPGEERPTTWSTRPVVVVPRTARITQLLLWWEEPDYLAVQLD